MDKAVGKKAGAALSAVLVIAMFSALPVMYFLMEVPVPVVAFSAIVVAVLSAVLVYCTVQRFREVEEGLDDAVDDY